MADDSPKSQPEALDTGLDTTSGEVTTSDTSPVTQETVTQAEPPAVEEAAPASEPKPPTPEEPEPEPASTATEATSEANPSSLEEPEPASTTTETTSEANPPPLQEPEPASTAKEITTELGRVAEQLIPHILNLYNSCPTATDFDALYAPNATFEDPLMQAHGVSQIKSAFYAMPKVFLDSTILKYTVEEEETSSPTSGEIRLDSLQQYKLLQLGPVGYYVTMQSLIKLTVEGGKVVRHEDLWGSYRLWNKHTVRVPLVGRIAETVRRGNMIVTHVLMGFGKDHKTLDKPRDASLQLKVS